MAAPAKPKDSRDEPEDMWHVEHIPRAGGRLAPRDIAASFSVESIFSTATPFGTHAPYKYLTADQTAQMLRAIRYDPRAVVAV